MLPVPYRKADGTVVMQAQKTTETVLGTCIASWPHAGDYSSLRFKKWVRRTARFMRYLYGDNLVGVYLHADEPQPHIHAVFHNFGANVKPLMSTHSAAAQVLAAGGTRKEAQEALKVAGVALQDAFQDLVGRWVGLSRKGPSPQARKGWWAAIADREAKRLALAITDEERATAAAAEIARREAEDQARLQAHLRLQREQAFVDLVRDWVDAGLLTREQARDGVEKYRRASRKESAPSAVPRM